MDEAAWAAVPDDRPRLYDWELTDGPGGVRGKRLDAIGDLTDALRTATGAARGEVRLVALSGSDYVPLRTVATGVRDDHGAIRWPGGLGDV